MEPPTKMGCEWLRHPIEDGDDEAICCIAFGRLMDTERLKSITNVDHRMLMYPFVDRCLPACSRS